MATVQRQTPPVTVTRADRPGPGAAPHRRPPPCGRDRDRGRLERDMTHAPATGSQA